jgi:hypothetical protein
MRDETSIQRPPDVPASSRRRALESKAERSLAPFLIYGTGIRNRAKPLTTKEKTFSNLRYNRSLRTMFRVSKPPSAVAPMGANKRLLRRRFPYVRPPHCKLIFPIPNTLNPKTLHPNSFSGNESSGGFRGRYRRCKAKGFLRSWRALRAPFWTSPKPSAPQRPIPRRCPPPASDWRSSPNRPPPAAFAPGAKVEARPLVAGGGGSQFHAPSLHAKLLLRGWLDREFPGRMDLRLVLWRTRGVLGIYPYAALHRAPHFIRRISAKVRDYQSAGQGCQTLESRLRQPIQPG